MIGSEGYALGGDDFDALPWSGVVRYWPSGFIRTAFLALSGILTPLRATVRSSFLMCAVKPRSSESNPKSWWISAR